MLIRSNFKKPLCLLFILELCFVSSSACDVCNIFEYANRTNRSYVGVFYRQRFFNGYQHLGNNHPFYIDPGSLQNASGARMAHEPAFQDTYIEKTKYDYELYKTLELRFNYAIRQHWNIQLIVPYLWNEIYYKRSFTFPKPVNDTLIRLNGLGDITFVADYAYSFNSRNGNIKHILKPGLGLKLPTGIYDRSSGGKKFDYDLQTGTGSFDIITRLNYLVTNDRWGADLFINYRLTGNGFNKVKFGNKWNIMTNVFYTVKIKSLSFLPKAGAYYECGYLDRVNAIMNASSGGQTWFYQYGIDFMLKDFILQMLYQKPFSENLNGQVIGNAGRLNLGLIYNFK